jgi:predicted transcriptional regulator
MRQSTDHFGRWLRREIENREMNIAAFAAVVGISQQRLWGVIATPAPRMRGDNIVRVARGLKLTREEVENRLREAAEGASRAAAVA